MTPEYENVLRWLGAEPMPEIDRQDERVQPLPGTASLSQIAFACDVNRETLIRMVSDRLLVVVDLVPIQHTLSEKNVVTAGAFSYLVPEQTDDLDHDYVCLSVGAHRFLGSAVKLDGQMGNDIFIA